MPNRQKNKKISNEEIKFKLIEIGHWLDTQKTFLGLLVFGWFQLELES